MLERVICSQCDAPIDIVSGQRYCRCEHCGSKYFVTRKESGPLSIESFESILRESLTAESFEVAKRRLAALEGEIVGSGQDVERKGTEFEGARSAHQVLLRECQKLVSPVQNWTYASGLSGLVAWFLGLFVLQGSEQYLGLAIAVLMGLVARGFRLEWNSAREIAQNRLRESREALGRAEEDRKEALALWESCYLERELVQRAVLRHEPPPSNGADGT